MTCTRATGAGSTALAAPQRRPAEPGPRRAGAEFLTGPWDPRSPTAENAAVHRPPHFGRSARRVLVRQGRQISEWPGL